MDKTLITQIDQIGIVVKDVEKAVERYSSIFGIRTFRFHDLTDKPARRRDRVITFTMKMATAQMGPTEIELIEPVEGDTIWMEFLTSKGEGLHHLGVFMDDTGKEAARLKERGIEVLQEGPSNWGPGNYYYMDTKHIVGVILELKPRPLQES